MNLMAGNVIKIRDGIMIRANMNIKKKTKHRVWAEVYAWNPSICACKCDRDCGFGEYLKGSIYMKSLDDNLVVTFDKL